MKHCCCCEESKCDRLHKIGALTWCGAHQVGRDLILYARRSQPGVEGNLTSEVLARMGTGSDSRSAAYDPKKPIVPGHVAGLNLWPIASQELQARYLLQQEAMNEQVRLQQEMVERLRKTPFPSWTGGW